VVRPTAIEAGLLHSLALTSDGRVWAWGANTSGQLGTNDAPQGHVDPTVVAGPGGDGQLSGVRAVQAGDNHSVALRSDGTVWAWGINDYHQLGTDTSALCSGSPCSPSPVPVVGSSGAPLRDVRAIAAGANHTVALKLDGTVWAWGRNDVGQTGTGGVSLSVDHATPVVDTAGRPLRGVVAIAAGLHHSLALTSTGAVLAWGSSEFGQLGPGPAARTCAQIMRAVDVPCTPAAVEVVGARGARLLAAGDNHNLALVPTGRVLAWGENAQGQLGQGTAGGFNATPAMVPSLTGVRAIAAGGQYSLAGRIDGSAWAWGDDGAGELGNSAPLSDSASPVRVTGLTRVTLLSAGVFHALALAGATAAPAPGGSAWSWGDNFAGQLGRNPGVRESPLPQRVNGF